MPRDGRSKTGRLVTEDTFAALVRAYKLSPKFLGYADATKALWARELDFMSEPDTLGALTRTEIRPSLVQGYIDGIAGLPGKQAAAMAALKQLEKWAVVRDLLPRQITLGVETEESEGEGHIPWTDEQVALAERYARPDIARAVTLGANTGQRGSDLVRMGPTDIETFKGADGNPVNGINVRQKKTKRQVWVPITSALAAAMETWERRPGPFLTRTTGRTPIWTRAGLTNAWAYERDRNPDLAPLRLCGPNHDTPLVLHGLRGHACVRLKRAGANTNQIADTVGMSEEMVKNYTRLSEQRENAVAAVYHLEKTLQERLERMSKKNAS
jgi:integrase